MRMKQVAVKQGEKVIDNLWHYITLSYIYHKKGHHIMNKKNIRFC